LTLLKKPQIPQIYADFYTVAKIGICGYIDGVETGMFGAGHRLADEQEVSQALL
jgi:hypothetical protein